MCNRPAREEGMMDRYNNGEREVAIKVVNNGEGLMAKTIASVSLVKFDQKPASRGGTHIQTHTHTQTHSSVA